MSKNPSILPLIEKWEEFTSQTNEVCLGGFAVWLLSQKREIGSDVIQKNDNKYKPIFEQEEKFLLNQNQEDEFFQNNNHKFQDLEGNFNFKQDYPKIPNSKGFTIFLISRLYKSVKFYFKDLLAQNNLNSLDDFTILATTIWKGQSTKKELCIYNMIDISTGMEIIRRLAKNGMLTEIQNKEDKREKLITITPLGVTTLINIFEESAKIPDVMSDLEDEKRVELIQVLEKLNHFHTQIYYHTIENK